MQRAVANGEIDPLHRADAAKALGDTAHFENRSIRVFMRFEEWRQRLVGERAASHSGLFHDFPAERRQKPLGNPDEAGRREHDEADEQNAEEEQPMRSPDRQEFPEQNIEQRAECGTQEAAHAAYDHHGDEFARERDSQRLGRGEAVIENRKQAANRYDSR